eukprot:2901994-Pleurochrysis_carterae.AAC.6
MANFAVLQGTIRRSCSTEPNTQAAKVKAGESGHARWRNCPHRVGLSSVAKPCAAMLLRKLCVAQHSANKSSSAMLFYSLQRRRRGARGSSAYIAIIPWYGPFRGAISLSPKQSFMAVVYNSVKKVSSACHRVD